MSNLLLSVGAHQWETSCCRQRAEKKIGRAEKARIGRVLRVACYGFIVVQYGIITIMSNLSAVCI